MLCMRSFLLEIPDLSIFSCVVSKIRELNNGIKNYGTDMYVIFDHTDIYELFLLIFYKYFIKLKCFIGNI